MAFKILFRAGEKDPVSPFFVIERQVTITAVGMQEDDVITFHMAKIKPGRFAMPCDCINVPPADAEIEALEPLMCPECHPQYGYMPVRLTKRNPVVVLDVPQHTPILAKYYGDGLGGADVFIETDTNTPIVSPSMRGCPAGCIDPNWQETGTWRCNVEDNTIEYQESDGLGNTRWTAKGDLTWTETGTTKVEQEKDDDGNVTEVVYKQEADQCGDIRWTAISDDESIWTWTGAQNCYTCAENDPETESSDQEYCVDREYKDQFGRTKWEFYETREWQNTGLTACEEHTIRYQQSNICGEVRWYDSGKSCGYYATLELPCGAYAFRSENADPEATVELQDCDGAEAGYIYPEPRDGATTEVRVGCDGEQELLGYGVNAYGGCGCTCGMGCSSCSASAENVQAIKTVQVPVTAVTIFNRNGHDYVLFSDGSAQLLNVVF